MSAPEDVHAWIALGVERGFCKPATCQTHTGVELTREEWDAEEEGHDPCVPVVRLLHPGEDARPSWPPADEPEAGAP